MGNVRSLKSSGLGSPARWHLILSCCFPWTQGDHFMCPLPTPCQGSQPPCSRGGGLLLSGSAARMPQAVNADSTWGVWVSTYSFLSWAQSAALKPHHKASPSPTSISCSLLPDLATRCLYWALTFFHLVLESGGAGQSGSAGAQCVPCPLNWPRTCRWEACGRKPDPHSLLVVVLARKLRGTSYYTVWLPEGVTSVHPGPSIRLSLPLTLKTTAQHLWGGAPSGTGEGLLWKAHLPTTWMLQMQSVVSFSHILCTVIWIHCGN